MEKINIKFKNADTRENAKKYFERNAINVSVSSFGGLVIKGITNVALCQKTLSVSFNNFETFRISLEHIEEFEIV